MIQRLALSLAATVLTASVLHAQEPSPAPEVLAQVKEGEQARFDLQSVKKYGDIQGQFDVFVTWDDESGLPRPKDYAPRRVRYMADCREGTMTVAAVGLLTPAGQLGKMVVAPPRSLDPVKPEKGSEQAKWVQQVCMF